jgi:hypothetical protein
MLMLADGGGCKMTTDIFLAKTRGSGGKRADVLTLKAGMDSAH